MTQKENKTKSKNLLKLNDEKKWKKNTTGLKTQNMKGRGEGMEE